MSSLKFLKYSFADLVRSRWTLLYTGFYLLFTIALLWLSSDLTKVTVSLMNVVLVLVPLIAIMFGITYSYDSRQFVELLLAQPVRRMDVFLGQYLGLALSLSLSLLIGVGLPALIFGVAGSGSIAQLVTVLVTGIALSFIFAAIAFVIALRFEHRLKGFGLGILVWLLLAIVYDGAFLLILAAYRDYPLEKFAIGASMFNPIDLGRVLILLQLDVSALMGFTGAVIQKFLGRPAGMLLAIGVLLLWIVLPLWRMRYLAVRKDF